MGRGRLHIETTKRDKVGVVEEAFSLTYLPSTSRFVLRQEAVAEHLVLGLSTAFVRGVRGNIEGHFNDPMHAVLEVRHPDVAPAAQALRRHLLSPNPHCRGAVYVESYATILLTHAIAGTEAPPRSKNRSKRVSRALLVTVLDEIERGLEERQTVEALAERYGFRPAAFSGAFKAMIGVSPRRYITELRLSHARRALAESSDSIVQIALRNGFSSQSHMTTTFKNVLGITPGAYRKQIQSPSGG